MLPRPLPKSLLKKLYLKVLWEIKHNKASKLTGSGWGIDHILGSDLPFFFGLKNDDPTIRKDWCLKKQEYEDALLGVEELHRDGFLRNDPSQGNDNFKLLTEKGLKYAEQELDKMTLPSVDIEQIISRPDLLNLVRDDYMNGEYDKAIRNAFHAVEETVRKKAGQPASAIGRALMTTAFNQNTGILKHPDAQTPAERQAFCDLFGGSIGWFRNPVSHRTVGYSDPQEAAQILAFASLLLDMVEKSA